MLRRRNHHLVVMRVLIATLAVTLTGACAGNPTSSQNVASIPHYTWRGTLIDSTTGLAVSGLHISVQEQPQHSAAGWRPVLIPDVTADGRWSAQYYLWNILPCATFSDTTLAIHLVFQDPGGRYQAGIHSTQWSRVCDMTAPPSSQLPRDFEDSVKIMLTRSP